MYGYGYRYNSGLVIGAGGGAPFVNTKSLLFDGTDDYLDCGVISTLQSASEFTMSCWVNSLNVTIRQGVLKWYFANSDWIELSITPASELQMVLANGGTPYGKSASSIVSNDTWYNIVIVYDGNGTANADRLKIYLNGNLITLIFTGIIPATTGTLNASTFRIGQRYINADYFLGNIDEVCILDRVVTPTEIATLSTAPTVDLTDLNPIAWYRNGDNGSWKSPQWLIPNNENKDKVSNYSLDFDGVDDKVELGTQSLGITGAISVSAWVKIPTTNTGGASPYIQQIVCEDRAGGTNRNWNLGWRGGGLNQINAVLFDSGGGIVVASTNAIVPNDGAWHNLMFTYTGDTSTDGLKLFVDGIQRAQATSSNGGLRSTTAIVPTIGGLSQAINWMFEGKIDEVSIFNTDQSSNIAAIYNSGTPTTITGAFAHYKMGEDSTFSGGVWTVPDAVGSNDGTSLNMTIEDRVGEAPNSTNNALSLNMDEVDRVTDVPT